MFVLNLLLFAQRVNSNIAAVTDSIAFGRETVYLLFGCANFVELCSWSSLTVSRNIGYDRGTIAASF